MQTGFKSYYAFFIITLRHLGHDTLILPTPLGTLILALQFLQRKYLCVFLFFHASRFIESHEVNFRFTARNFIFSLYLFAMFLENILNMHQKSKIHETIETKGFKNTLARIVKIKDKIIRKKFNSSLPYLPIMN